MKIESSQQGASVVVRLAGKLDAATAPLLERECETWAGQGPRRLVLDLGGLDYISSAGLRAVLVSAKKLKAQGGALSLCALSEPVREVFDISGFAAVFPLFDTLEAALASHP